MNKRSSKQIDREITAALAHARHSKILRGDRLIEIADPRGGWSVVTARDDEPSEIVAEANENAHHSVLSRVGTEHVWLRAGKRPKDATVVRGGGFGAHRLEIAAAAAAPVHARKKTTIEIYPSCPKPPWLVVGAEVEVLGEGRGRPFRITAIESSRAAVIPKSQYRKGHKGGCWESFTKIYRPDHFDEDFAFTHEPRANSPR